MSNKQIGVLVGSLRAGSYCRAVATAAAELAPASLELHMLEIGDLPLYNQNMDDNGAPPEAYARFRGEIASMDGFLFVTPEYNRSLPAALKNALDVASRPYGHNAWNGKPGAIISASMGAMGGQAANLALRQPMVFLNVPIMQQPEAYIGKVDSLLDDHGRLTNTSTRKFLQTYMEAFERWVFAVSDAR
jgi:chromate reductase, NAD(P)H dehydrogenase (quinone)